MLTQADKLLLMIEEYSDEGRFWMAETGYTHVHRIDEKVLVGGSGDASILRSFARKGWIEFEPKLGKYACRITEDGRLRASTLA